jgi:hypothetical protein
MCINDIVFAYAIDESLPYFTYEDNKMVIVNSKKNAILGINEFKYIENYIEALISHESIHAIIKKIEPNVDPDAIDDIEVIVKRGNIRFQVTMNNLAFATDNSGLVLSDNLN